MVSSVRWWLDFSLSHGCPVDGVAGGDGICVVVVVVVMACCSYYLAGCLPQVSFPLSLVGAIAGKNFAGPFDAPCRTKNAVREIPPIPWYRGPGAQVLVAGFLPFRCDGVCESEGEYVMCVLSYTCCLTG